MPDSSWIVYSLIILQLIITVYYSFRARRQADPLKRGLYFARMNIMIGVLFITLSLAQLFGTPYNFLLIGFAILVLLVGLYNLFVGIRNHGVYTRMLNSKDS